MSLIAFLTALVQHFGQLAATGFAAYAQADLPVQLGLPLAFVAGTIGLVLLVTPVTDRR